MSGSRPHRHRVPGMRAKLVIGAAAAVCAALTAGQVLLPVLASAHPDGHGTDSRGHHRPAPKPADPDQNCTLIVPPAPLSAAGLATPYRFLATDRRAGACHESNANQSAFVEAADPRPRDRHDLRLPPARDRRRDAARDPTGPPGAAQRRRGRGVVRLPGGQPHAAPDAGAGRSARQHPGGLCERDTGIGLRAVRLLRRAPVLRRCQRRPPRGDACTFPHSAPHVTASHAPRRATSAWSTRTRATTCRAATSPPATAVLPSSRPRTEGCSRARPC